MSGDRSDGYEIVEDVMNKSVSCINIPDAFLDKTTAKQHFSQFGRIHSITLSPKRRICTVEYETEDAAEVALIDGGFYNGEVFEIFSTPKVPSIPRLMIDYINPEVQDELSAMAPQRARVAVAVDASIAKPIFTTKSLETKRVPRLKSINDQSNLKVITKNPLPLKPGDQIVKSELEAILKKPAFTSEEKYRVLDARDKLIRLTTSKNTDIKTVSTTQGVCPDMCPEKERLMREATHRVSSYELEENSKNVMKHSLALKQYARSSADQESALPHELRPEPILKMTMNYLLHNIVDLCDSSEASVGDWFHFVWDRTRSIRKEISQQELCSQTAVSLVEQCARFHIHCAARLVAEEAQIFDQKINSENLTKCLQSLKYLYHDLNLRREQCVNEPEFRAYVVLLNLYDSQFFWEVKQFPRHILHSKEIRFAIDIYLAMANNNYVKFFKLVRQTSYMNACILLRYFNQVRVGALNAMVKAYVARQPVLMNISYWHYILAFEDYEQTVQFFEYYGMQCDKNEDRVFLDRNSLYYPSLPLIMDRAINVIEHKRTCSVGEALHGGPLEKFDDFLKYVPHDSFDDDGLLFPDAWTAEDQNYLNPPTPKRKTTHTPFRDEDSVFKIPQAPSPKSSSNQKPSIFSKLSPKLEPKLNFSNTSQSTIKTSFGSQKASLLPSSSNNLFTKSTFNGVGPLSKTFQSKGDKQTLIPTNSFGSSTSSNAYNFSAPITSNNENLLKSTANTSGIFSSSTSSPNTFVSFLEKFATTSEAVNDLNAMESKMLEVEKQKIEMKTRTEDAATLFVKQKLLQEEQKGKDLKEKLEKEREEKVRTDTLKRLKQIKVRSLQNVDEIINEFIKEELENIATDAVEYYYHIENVAEAIYCELLAEIVSEKFTDWERLRQEKIEKIESTPMWITDKPLFEFVPDLMHPLQDITLNMKKRYRRGIPNNPTIPVAHEELIDIFEIVSSQLHANSSASERIKRKSTFWKCGISIPNSTEDKSCHRIEKWLDNIFLRREPVNSKWFFCEQYFVPSTQRPTAICLRKFRGSEMINEEGSTDSNDANGMNGIVFLMSAANAKETRKRLIKVLEQQSSNCAIGIVMLDLDNANLTAELDDLTTNSKVSIKYFYFKDTHVRDTSFHTTRRKLFAKCLKFVAINFNFKTPLRMECTTSFFDHCLSNQFWHRILTSSSVNPGLFKAATNINFIIRIYNTAIDKIEEIILQDFSSHPLFPQELKSFVKTNSNDVPLEYQNFPSDWKDENRFTQLQKFLTSLRLRPILLKTATIEDIQQQLLDYAHRHITDRSRSDRAAYRMIQKFFEYLETDRGEQTLQQQINNFNWINSTRFLTLEILKFQYESNSLNIPKEVIYNCDDLQQFLGEPWWLLNNSPMNEVQLSFSFHDEDGVPAVKKARIVPIDKEELDHLITRSATCLKEADRKINKFKATMIAGREITQELDALLYKHEQHLRIYKLRPQMHKE